MADSEQEELGEEAGPVFQGELRQERSPPSLHPCPFVTFREPVTEIYSLLSDMYLEEENEEEDEEEVEDVEVDKMDAKVTSPSECMDVNTAVKHLQSKVMDLEEDFKRTSDKYN